MLPQNQKFIQKVYCMNLQPPVEVTRLNDSLRDFSAEIKPENETEQRRMGQKVVETIKEKSNYKIARTLFAGSFGKRTNVRSSDIDCVCFINDKLPPFDDVLAEFHNICNQSTIKAELNVELKKKSIQFTGKNFEMDLVVATNFVKEPKKNQSLPHIQQKYALERIRENPVENCYKFSAALAEASVYFMKTRVGFANEMARIAKYWLKTLNSSEFGRISGASTFIELVAVHAARHGRRGKRKYNSHLKAFIRFLQSLMKFEELNVAFNRCNPMFKEHPPGDSAIPRVIDPVNPYNNYANYWTSEAIALLKDSASITYESVQDLILNAGYSEDQIIDVLFKL